MIALRTVVQITLLSAAAALVGCASAPAGREADEALLKDPLLSEARVAHEVVPEAFITALTPSDNLDSPASWMAPDGRRWVIATAKGTHAWWCSTATAASGCGWSAARARPWANSTAPMAFR
ncbi:exported hypothetical protein [Xanthomonas citri pv. fuscans]|nr:exported hypothetical protein [Xanthomonas citri pv. fuscans]